MFWQTPCLVNLSWCRLSRHYLSLPIIVYYSYYSFSSNNVLHTPCLHILVLNLDCKRHNSYHNKYFHTSTFILPSGRSREEYQNNDNQYDLKDFNLLKCCVLIQVLLNFNVNHGVDYSLVWVVLHVCHITIYEKHSSWTAKGTQACRSLCISLILYYFLLCKCMIRSAAEEKRKAVRSLIKFHLFYIYIWVINITKYKVQGGLAQRYL